MSDDLFLYIVRRLKENEKLLFIASRLYSILFSPSTLLNGSNIRIRGAFLRRVKIKVHGSNSQVTICPKVMMKDCVISVSGDNCKVFIEGGGTNIHHCHIEVRDTNSEVTIKKGFTSEQVSLHACEGRKIVIGEDCMFSAGIYISTSDFHSIMDSNTGERMNPARDVVIGDHVWLGLGVTILKGSVIADHIVVGKSSIVTSWLREPYSIYVGMPAKKVKNGVIWKRDI